MGPRAQSWVAAALTGGGFWIAVAALMYERIIVAGAGCGASIGGLVLFAMILRRASQAMSQHSARLDEAMMREAGNKPGPPGVEPELPEGGMR